MTPHPLTNFEIETYYQNKPRFNGVHSRDNLRDKIKDGAYVVNLDEHSNIGTQWVALYVNTETVTYFDSFGVKQIPKQISFFINNRSIIANIFQIQSYESMMYGYLCASFINLTLEGCTLTDYTNLFLPDNLKRNDYIVLNYFLTNF